MPKIKKINLGGTIYDLHDADAARAEHTHEISYNELLDKPAIPTKVSELTNDLSYIGEEKVLEILNNNSSEIEGLDVGFADDFNAESDEQIPTSLAINNFINAVAQRKLVQGSGIKLNEETNEISSYAISDDLTNITNENLLYREYNSNEPVPLVVGDTQVYINYTLSVDEVVNLIATKLNEDSQWSPISLSTSLSCRMDKDQFDNCYAINFNGQLIFTTFSEDGASYGYYKGFYGWNPNFIEKWKLNNGLAFDGASIGESVTELHTDFHLLDPLFSSTPFNIPAESKIYSAKDGKKFELQNKLQAGLGIDLDNLTNKINSRPILGSASLEESLFYRGGRYDGSVPNSGYIGAIKVNTSLSEEETLTILNSVEYAYGFVYVIALAEDGTTAIAIMKDDGLTLIVEATTGTILFVSTDGSMLSTEQVIEEYGFVGWNPNFTGSIPFNATLMSSYTIEEEGVTLQIGLENSKLITLFTCVSGDNTLYYLANGEKKFIATDVIKEVSTLPEDINIPEKEVSTIPVNGEIKTIKIDTSKTKEEVNAILSQLTFQSEYVDGYYGVYSPACWFEYDQTASNPIATMNGAAIEIQDHNVTREYNLGSIPYFSIKYSRMVNGTTAENIEIFNSLDSHDFASNNGWNPDFSGEIVLTNFVTTGLGFNSFSEEERLVGNEILKDFMTAVLPGVNKKVDKQEDIFYKALGTTPVPNSGYIEKLYLNTALSTEEVVKILSNLQYHDLDGPTYCIAFCENKDNIVVAGVYDGVYGIMDYASESPCFISADVDLGFVGWNPDFDGTITIEDTVLNSYESFPLGEQNDKLTNLVSTTPSFGSDSNNKQGLFYFENNEAKKVATTDDIIAPVVDSGATEAQFNRHDGYGVPVPTAGKIDKIYLNTTLSSEEISEIILSLDWPSTAEIAGMGIEVGIYPIAVDKADSLNALSLCKLTNINTGVSTYSLGYKSLSGTLFDTNHLGNMRVDPTNSSNSWSWCWKDSIEYFSCLDINIEESASSLSLSDLGLPSVSVGDQNSKLSKLLSIRPFANVSKTILQNQSKNAYLTIQDIDYSDLLKVKATKYVWDPVPVPTKGIVNNVYINTALTADQINSILNGIEFTTIPNYDKTTSIEYLPISSNYNGDLSDGFSPIAFIKSNAGYKLVQFSCSVGQYTGYTEPEPYLYLGSAAGGSALDSIKQVFMNTDTTDTSWEGYATGNIWTQSILDKGYLFVGQQQGGYGTGHKKPELVTEILSARPLKGIEPKLYKTNYWGEATDEEVIIGNANEIKEDEVDATLDEVFEEVFNETNI